MTSVSRTITVLVGAVALFAFTSASSQEQQVEKTTQVSKAEGKKEQSGSKDHNTKGANQSPAPHEPPFVAKVTTDIEQPIAHEKPNGEEKNEKKEEAWWAKLLADPVAFFTCLLFLATLALWWSTRRLVIGAEKSSRHQLRAYISSQPNFIVSFSPKIPATMRYAIENHGQTPAYSVRHVAVVDILPYPLPVDFRLPPLPTPMAASLTLHPREAIFGNVTAQRVFTAQEISDVAANNGCRIYCFGNVIYESFGSTHITKFCRSVIGCQNLQSIGSGTTKTNLDLNYEITSCHNEAN